MVVILVWGSFDGLGWMYGWYVDVCKLVIGFYCDFDEW